MQVDQYGIPLSLKEQVRRQFRREIPYGDPLPPRRFALAYIDLGQGEQVGAYVFYVVPINYFVKLAQILDDWWNVARGRGTRWDREGERLLREAAEASWKIGFEKGKEIGISQGYERGYDDGLAAFSNIFNKKYPANRQC